MIFITDESELQLNNDATVLYFYAPWMPFNKKMLLMISKIEEKYKNIIFYCIDTDSFKNLCKRFEIEEIPTTIIFKNKKECKKIKGIVMSSAFKSAFNDIFSTSTIGRKL
jgi:thiol-disulfide isomerase/thioredoxin